MRGVDETAFLTTITLSTTYFAETMTTCKLRMWVESHLVNYDAFINDDFDRYFIDRAKAIMRVIESAMEKNISDKGSEQTINSYGVNLED